MPTLQNSVQGQWMRPGGDSAVEFGTDQEPQEQGRLWAGWPARKALALGLGSTLEGENWLLQVPYPHTHRHIPPMRNTRMCMHTQMNVSVLDSCTFVWPGSQLLLSLRQRLSKPGLQIAYSSRAGLQLQSPGLFNTRVLRFELRSSLFWGRCTIHGASPSLSGQGPSASTLV